MCSSSIPQLHYIIVNQGSSSAIEMATWIYKMYDQPVLLFDCLVSVIYYLYAVDVQ